jgi:DNA-binding HxlR family transcriptional regulator
MNTMELPANRRCSVARSLEILGQKWNFLIIREAFWGHTRFAEFRTIGIPSDVLSARLDSLVDAGILERQPYQLPGERARTEYRLTPAGHDLLPVLAALATWGDQHVPTGYGPATLYRDTSTGRGVRIGFVDADGREVDTSHVAAVAGPGLA